VEAPVESDLVRAAQSGDEEALGVLLREYLPLLYNVVGRALNGHADVDDVVQETLFRAAQAIPALREPERFRSWLIAIAVRQIHERARGQARRAARESSLERLGDRADPSLDFVGATILELGLSGERRELAEASRWLSTDDRALLALWWQELGGRITRAELAEVLGLSRQHAAVRLQRMKSRLELARVLLRSRLGRRGCPRLSAMIPEGRLVPDPRMLNRLARHVRRCDQCQALSGQLLPPENLLASVALVPFPLALAHVVPGLVSSALTQAPAGVASLAAAGAKVFATEGALSKPVLAVKPAVLTGVALTGAAVTLGFAVQYLPSGQTPAPRPTFPVATAPAASPTPTVRATRPPTRTTSSPPARGFGVLLADYYVAPDGDDHADGSLDHPLASVGRAAALVRPGQTIAVRGGEYRLSAPLVLSAAGESGHRITLSNFRGEHPVLEAADSGAKEAAVTVQGAYWTVQGLAVTGSPSVGLTCSSCRGVVLTHLAVHDNHGVGVELRGDGTVDNQVVDVDSYANHDDSNDGADADGFLMLDGSGTGNVIRRCRFFDNSDDGLDIIKFADPVTVDGSWAFGNGVNRWHLSHFGGTGNGFVLQGTTSTDHPVAYTLTNNAAWDNAGPGFSGASNPGELAISRNTAFHNHREGFLFRRGRPQLSGNISLLNSDSQADLTSVAVAAGNSWNDSGWSAASLLSTDPTDAEGSRPVDGGLPPTRFLVSRRAGFGAPM